MSTQTPQQWLLSRFPNCKALDEIWTFERYDYPENVRQWIRDNWIKVSDDNGGTYYEGNYHRKKFPHLYEKEVENPEEKQDKEDDTKGFAENYKKNQCLINKCAAAEKSPDYWFFWFYLFFCFP